MSSWFGVCCPLKRLLKAEPSRHLALSPRVCDKKIELLQNLTPPCSSMPFVMDRQTYRKTRQRVKKSNAISLGKRYESSANKERNTKNKGKYYAESTITCKLNDMIALFWDQRGKLVNMWLSTIEDNYWQCISLELRDANGRRFLTLCRLRFCRLEI